MSHKLATSIIVIALGLTACGGGDDSDTTNATNVTTLSTSVTTVSNDSSGGESSSSGGTSASTTMATTTPAESSTSGGSECMPTDECQGDGDCPGGGMCIGCICVGGTTGSGDCPDGETCQMTGAGGMACLGEPDHCVLACGGAMTCPDSMSCQNGACQYDTMNPPPMGDPNYPLPTAMNPPCPDGMIGVSFGPMGYAVCAPACDGMGLDAMCPQAASGSAVGACLFNPTSSGMMCMG